MKLIHLLFVLLFIWALFIKESISQDKVPKSYVNIGLGAGANYGGLGAKTVIGYKNSGFMAGVGILPGSYNKVIGYEVGGQISMDYFYINLGYGIFRLIEVVNDKTSTGVEAGNFSIGGMINLTKKKNTFIDLGIGHTFGARTFKIGRLEVIDPNAFTFNFGIGYRLGPYLLDN